MADRYIERQRAIIKRHIKGIWPMHLTLMLIIFSVVVAVIVRIGPPPAKWKTDEITIVDIRHLDRPRNFSRYGTPDYELTDQNGKLNWLEGELTWPQLGASYTIKYVDQEGFYREFKAVSQGNTILVSELDSIALWEDEAPDFCLFLLPCLVAVVYLHVILIRNLRHPEIRACRERIRAHEEKLHARAMNKHRK